MLACPATPRPRCLQGKQAVLQQVLSVREEMVGALEGGKVRAQCGRLGGVVRQGASRAWQQWAGRCTQLRVYMHSSKLLCDLPCAGGGGQRRRSAPALRLPQPGRVQLPGARRADHGAAGCPDAGCGTRPGLELLPAHRPDPQPDCGAEEQPARGAAARLAEHRAAASVSAHAGQAEGMADRRR